MTTGPFKSGDAVVTTHAGSKRGRVAHCVRECRPEVHSGRWFVHMECGVKYIDTEVEVTSGRKPCELCGAALEKRSK